MTIGDMVDKIERDRKICDLLCIPHTENVTGSIWFKNEKIPRSVQDWFVTTFEDFRTYESRFESEYTYFKDLVSAIKIYGLLRILRDKGVTVEADCSAIYIENIKLLSNTEVNPELQLCKEMAERIGVGATSKNIGRCIINLMVLVKDGKIYKDGVVAVMGLSVNDVMGKKNVYSHFTTAGLENTNSLIHEKLRDALLEWSENFKNILLDNIDKFNEHASELVGIKGAFSYGSTDI